ncbi:MAG: GNAT family N-acetyltransferase [Pseudooceanicola sp.]
MIYIEPGNAADPGPARLLAASRALMDAEFDPESNHYLAPDAYSGPDMHFLTARKGTEVVGCIALALRDGYGEIKSLFVDETARGTGAADALMRAVEDLAREAELPCLRLETGDTLTAARRLYARHGFVEIEPFGSYGHDPRSVYMEKSLDG